MSTSSLAPAIAVVQVDYPGTVPAGTPGWLSTQATFLAYTKSAKVKVLPVLRVKVDYKYLVLATVVYELHLAKMDPQVGGHLFQI